MALPSLAGFQPPSGAFDPAGDWEHRYGVWVLLPNARNNKSRKMGELSLRRTRAGEAAFDLRVTMTTEQQAATVCKVEASMRCRADVIAAVTEWRLTSEMLDNSGAALADTRCELRGNGEKDRASNWSLLEAVQRVPAASGEVRFNMLEDLDLLKTDQRLHYRGPAEIDLAGRTLRLHGFEQIGHGILPCDYWRDEQGRLLFAIGGVRALIWENV